MKILTTQDSDWIEKGPWQQHHLAERLTLRGHEILIIDYEILWRTKGKKELYSRRQVFNNVSKIFKDAGASSTVIRPGILKIPILDYVSMLFTYKKEIKRQIHEFDPDIIVSGDILSTYLAFKAAKKSGIPIVFLLIDVEHRLVPFKFLQRIGKIIESKNLKRADRVVAINEKLKDYAIRMGANPDGTYVVRAGIDFERFNQNLDTHAIREQYGIKEDDIVLLFTGFFRGRIAKISGLREVALALSKVNDPRIKFLIVGEGDISNELQEIRERYNLQERLILAGKKTYDEIPAFICASDICLLSYHNVELTRDIVPIKMYEYMAAKKPVISTRLPGVVKEFCVDHGVIYVDRPEDILKKVVELVENGTLKEQGSKARRFVEKYNWDGIVDEFEGILEDTIREG